MPENSISNACIQTNLSPTNSTQGIVDAGHSSISAEILDANPVPCFVIDAQHRVVHWNKGCEQVLGVSAGEMTGTTEHWRAFYPKCRPTLADLIVDHRVDDIANNLYQPNSLRRSVLIAGAYEAEAFFAQLGPNGKYLFFTAAPIVDNNGQIVGAVETLQDVSAQRNAETALLLSHENLEKEVALRTAELAESNRQLAASLHKTEALNHIKRAFLETISHELKTPLNGIIGIAALIRMSPGSTETAEYAAIIHESGQRLFKHVSDILDLSEMEAGEARAFISPHSTRELVESVVSNFTALASSKGIELSLKFSPDTPEIIATDGQRFSKCLSLLIDNAVKYTQEGSIQLSISTDLNSLLINIRDTGPGISDESRHSIFEKFRQADSSGFRRESGLGLGLALARGQAGVLGGKLTLESPASGSGACFILCIPKCTKDQPSNPQ